MTTRPQLLRDEHGLAASALLVTAMLAGLAIFVFLAVPYGDAVDTDARNQTAADAAALAGAEGARESVLTSIATDGLPESWSGFPGGAGLGQAAAADYAQRNGSRLVSYWFDVTDGTAHVETEGDTVDGAVARTEAVAEVALPRCELPELPEPEPTDPGPGPGPGPGGPPDEPPEPVELAADCGPFTLGFTVTFDEDGPRVELDPGQTDQIADAMEVRLVA